MKVAVTILALALAFGGLVARAESGQVYFDEAHMPRCIANASDPSAGLFFSWPKGKLYGRTIKAVAFRENPENISKYEAYGCADWKNLQERLPSLGKVLSADEQSRGGYELSPEVQKALAQIRSGGVVFHEETNAEDFLAAHPIELFTRSVNRELTAKYGLGFTADLYASYVSHSSPNNPRFASLVDAKLADSSFVSAIPSRFANVTMMLANGYMQKEGKDRLHILANDLRAVGIRTIVFNLDSVASIEDNAKSMLTQIQAEIDLGHKIILAGGSKGVPELLSALGKLPKSDMGRVLAVVSFSGLSDGSFLVDWAKRFPFNLIAKILLKQTAKNEEIKLTTFEGLWNMATDYFSKNYSNVLQALPRDVKYFCLIGVPASGSRIRDAGIASIQNKFVHPFLRGYGANDGYVEFPGTTIPRSNGLDVYELTFDAVHGISDGFYKGIDMQLDGNRRAVMNAVFDAIGDVLEMPK